MRRHAVAILALTLVAGNASAASKEECLAAHEASQVSRRGGQLRLAKDQLMVCSSEACPRIVREACGAWLEELAASMPTIVLEARGLSTASVQVTMDGRPLADHLDGRAVTIDPGEHRFHFEAAGGKHRELKLLVPEGRKNMAVVADFTERPPPAPAPIEVDRSRRTAGFVAWGVGGAFLVGGAITGILAMSAADDVVCPRPCRALTPSGAPNPELVRGNEAYDRSQTLAWVTDIAIGAGILAAAIGTYLVLSSPAPRPRASLVPAPVRDGGGLFLQGPL